ncbi:MAG: PHP domain-containing protein [Acidobacteria bacterium]|nr:PHP domain-containing protein [Acidobacteriota bacterium]
MMKGVLHLHSTFSDGEDPLERVIHAVMQAGMDFACVSDHAEVFDDTRMKDYVGLCQTLSTHRFLVIPGLEFALHGGTIHILGYGITRRIRFAGMEDLVDRIHEAGGIAVLAHPPAGTTNLIGSIKAKLDGIEIWNGRYDGIHAPRADSIQLLRKTRHLNLKTFAYCGIDLHKIGQVRKPLYLEVETGSISREAIFTSLRAGLFALKGSNHTIPSTGDLTFVQELSIAVKQPLCRPWAG